MILSSACLHVTINSRVLTGFYFFVRRQPEVWAMMKCSYLLLAQHPEESGRFHTFSEYGIYATSLRWIFWRAPLKEQELILKVEQQRPKRARTAQHSTAQQQHQCVGLLFSVFMTIVEPFIYYTLKWRVCNTVWSRVKQRTDQGFDTTSSLHMVPDFHLRGYYSILWLQ